jgi:hypothetical protein
VTVATVASLCRALRADLRSNIWYPSQHWIAQIDAITTLFGELTPVDKQKVDVELRYASLMVERYATRVKA